MMSSLGVHFQWVVFATSRACGGAKESVFKSQARTRAGDANEMRSAVKPTQFPGEGPVRGDVSWGRAGSWGNTPTRVRWPAQTATD